MAKEYNIAKTSGQCVRCGKDLEPGEQIVAALKETETDLQRKDFCAGCWENQAGDEQDELFGTWRSCIPRPHEKKKTFIDDDLLVDFFRRLEGTDAPGKINFRFVLGLLLMRKKLLVYDGTESASPEADVWEMHVKGSDKGCKVIDPHMDEDRIAEVSDQLGQILEAEL